MTLKYFYAKLRGYVNMRLSTDENAMCKHDFWRRYRMGAEWDAEIDTVYIEPAQNGRCTCIITLKAA